MDLKTEGFCPLGKQCQTAEDGVIKQCNWFVKLQGQDPQTGENIEQYKCAIAWMPILAIEGNGMSNSIAASIQSLRNETIKRQDVALGVINAKTITAD